MYNIKRILEKNKTEDLQYKEIENDNKDIKKNNTIIPI